MDVRFINPFIAGIKNVVSTMLKTDIIISKPRVKGSDEPVSDATAVIGKGKARRLPTATAVQR